MHLKKWFLLRNPIVGFGENKYPYIISALVKDEMTNKASKQ